MRVLDPFFCSDGETMCIGLFSRNAQWNAAAQHCNSEYNSDLLNVRQLEKFSERDPVIEQQIVSDIQNLSKSDIYLWLNIISRVLNLIIMCQICGYIS